MGYLRPWIMACCITFSLEELTDLPVPTRIVSEESLIEKGASEEVKPISDVQEWLAAVSDLGQNAYASDVSGEKTGIIWRYDRCNYRAPEL